MTDVYVTFGPDDAVRERCIVLPTQSSHGLAGPGMKSRARNATEHLVCTRADAGLTRRWNTCVPSATVSGVDRVESTTTTTPARLSAL